MRFDFISQESSRSHAVFTIIVEHAEYDAAGESVVTIGKLRMVDLAGSERYIQQACMLLYICYNTDSKFGDYRLDIDAQNRQQEETKNINVSLHAFGKVHVFNLNLCHVSSVQFKRKCRSTLLIIVAHAKFSHQMYMGSL